MQQFEVIEKPNKETLLSFIVRMENSISNTQYSAEVFKYKLHENYGDNIVIIKVDQNSGITWDIFAKLIRRTQSECRARYPSFKIIYEDQKYKIELIKFGAQIESIQNTEVLNIYKLDSNIGLLMN